MNQLFYSILTGAILLSISQFSQAQTQKGQDIDGEAAGDYSGVSVCMPDAKTLAIGAHHNNGNGSGPGHVRIYGWNGKTWIQKGSDIDGEGRSDASGIRVCMSDADHVAIGATSNDGNGSHSGHVRIYAWNGSGWVQKGNDIDGEAAGDLSGRSVSMPDSNTVAIGAPYNGGNGDRAGHVRIYAWNGKSWIQKGLDIDGEEAFDYSGWSVSMPDSNTLAIGANGNDGNGSDGGHVRIYDWNGKAWVQKGTDIDGEARRDGSGVSVSMPDVNTVGIGAIDNDGNGENSGHVRVYGWDGKAWVKKGADIDGRAADDNSGFSVSMPNANTVAIGVRANKRNGKDAGYVRVYHWNGKAWVKRWNDIEGETADDESGRSVSMPDSNTVAISAPGNSDNGIFAGHVRVYEGLLVSAEEIDIRQGIQLYPNPTHNFIHVERQKRLGSLRVTISNVQGHVIREKYINNSPTQTTIDLPERFGWYIITVTPQGGLPAHFKVLKL